MDRRGCVSDEVLKRASRQIAGHDLSFDERTHGEGIADLPTKLDPLDQHVGGIGKGVGRDLNGGRTALGAYKARQPGGGEK